jgi:hypothetical protein
MVVKNFYLEDIRKKHVPNPQKIVEENIIFYGDM